MWEIWKICYIIYMDGLNDIHLLPDSMIYIGGEGGRGSLYTLSGFWGGWNLVMVYSNTCTSYLQLKIELQKTFFKSQCLVCRVEGEEFSPNLVDPGSAVADLDYMVQLWWLRYEVWRGSLWSSLLPLHLLPSSLPPSFSHPSDYT